MRHLTDEEIQAYLDDSAANLDPGLLVHLKTCRQCRQVLGDYRALFAGLADDAAFEAPRDLAGTVTSRLGLKRTRRRVKAPGDLVLVAFGIVAMAIAVSVFVDLRPLLDTVSAVGRPLIKYASPHLASVHDRLIDANQMPTILAVGIAILVIMWALDAAFKLKHLNFVRRGR